MAQRVFRKVASGRFKERALTAVPALAEGCAFRDRVRLEMEAEHLDPNDSATGIVFVDRDMAALYEVKLTPGEETRALEKMMQVGAITIGLVIAIRDRERNERIIKAYPFLKGEQSLKWLSQVLDREEVQRYVN